MTKLSERLKNELLCNAIEGLESDQRRRHYHLFYCLWGIGTFTIALLAFIYR
jgi:hypothetical protein